MKGHHEVQIFIKEPGVKLVLPEGWKPFAVYGSGAPLFIVCRKWVRSEE